MTPFEAAGYTKDTVFRVCAADEAFPLGTLVKLEEDDGSECPLFDSSTDTAYIFLSGLEYVSGPRKILMNRELNGIIEVLRTEGQTLSLETIEQIAELIEKARTVKERG